MGKFLIWIVLVYLSPQEAECLELIWYINFDKKCNIVDIVSILQELNQLKDDMNKMKNQTNKEPADNK